MLKSILLLKGSQKLNKSTQKNIKGGVFSICPQLGGTCTPGSPVSCITAQPICCGDNNVFVPCSPFIQLG